MAKNAKVDAPPSELRVDLIDLSGHNPRKTFDPDALNELKASIQAHGILEPLVVRPRIQGRYELVAGERRLRAAQELGLATVPVAVRDLDDTAALECMLLENLQRQDLEPLEEAQAIKLVLESTGIKQQDLAKRLGKSQSWISNRVRLAEAPAELQELIPRGITPRHVFEVLRFQPYPDLFGEMVEALGNSLEQGYVPTIEELQDTVVAERITACSWNGAATLDLDDLPRQYQDLKEYLDFHECPRPECQEHIYVMNMGDGEHRFCLNKACFLEKLSKAKGTREAELRQKSATYANETDCSVCDNWQDGKCSEGCTNDEDCEDAYVERDEEEEGEDEEEESGEKEPTSYEKLMQEAPKYPAVDPDDIPDLPNGQRGYETFYSMMSMDQNGRTKLEQFGCPKDCGKLRCQEGKGNYLFICLDPACYSKRERQIRAAEMKERRDLWKGIQEELINARLSQLPGVPDKVLRDILGIAINHWREGAQKALRPWGKVDRVSELTETARKLPSHSLQDALLRVWVCKELGFQPTAEKAEELIAKLKENGNGTEASALEPEAVEEGGKE